MATIDQRAQAAQDGTLIRRVKLSAVTAAINISAESDQTPNHANRAAFARSVLLSPETYAPRLAEAVMAQIDQSDASAVTDAEISSTLGGVWNAYAGTGS